MHEAFWKEWKLTEDLRSTDDRLRLVFDQVAAVSSFVADIGPVQYMLFLIVLFGGFRHIL